MSVLAVGLSHHSAPVAVLERVALSADGVGKLLADLRGTAHVAEALVLATCNRTEVYAEVDRFHAGVQDLTELLARATGVAREELAPYLYVHYEDRAVEHVFTVAAGLDSMVVGEAQVLGQVRAAYARAREEDTLGRALGPLVQQALRVGKRVHAETGVDRAGASVVGNGLELAGQRLDGLVGRPALVLGAGSMGALAAALLRRAGVGSLVVANRTEGRAASLAAAYGGRPVGLDRLADEIAAADVVVTCTGASGSVVPAESVAAAVTARAGRPLAIVDLALPHDVDPRVQGLPGVTLIDLETLRGALGAAAADAEVEAARRIVTDEVAGYLTWQRSTAVAPTVVALRAKAADVVAAELARLDARLPELDPRARAELASTVRRVVGKLLHAPTVRVKELADEPGGRSYAEALRELFDLDPAAPEAVRRAAVAVDDAPLSPPLPGEPS